MNITRSLLVFSSVDILLELQPHQPPAYHHLSLDLK